MKSISFRCRTILMGAALSLASSAQSSEDSIDDLAARLIAMRAEVETLNEELDLLKQEHRTQMSSLGAQQAELETSANRQRTQLKQLQAQLQESQTEASEAGVDNDALTPVLLNAVDNLRAHIAQSLPFKRDDRIAELDDIVAQLETNVVPANRAANRLWAFFEDEIRLTRENGIHSQTIEVDGRRQLADVAKLGQMMMFYRTEDMRYGEVVAAEGNGYRFRAVTDARKIAAIETLFDSLQKQIRQGYFELPNVLAAMGGES